MLRRFSPASFSTTLLHADGASLYVAAQTGNIDVALTNMASSSSFAPPKLADFILTERLGSGSYATVYKAYRKVGFSQHHTTLPLRLSFAFTLLDSDSTVFYVKSSQL